MAYIYQKEASKDPDFGSAPVLNAAENHQTQFEQAAVCDFTCPSCGHSTEVVALLPIYPLEAGECGECNALFYLFGPGLAGHGITEYLLSYFLKQKPIPRKRAYTKWKSKRDHEARKSTTPVNLQQRVHNVSEVDSTLQLQAGIFEYKDEVVDGFDLFDPPSGPEASLMYYQNFQSHIALLPIAVGSYISLLSVLGQSAALIVAVILLLLTITSFYRHYKTVEESINKTGIDISPDDLLLYDPSPVPLIWMRLFIHGVEKLKGSFHSVRTRADP